MEYFLQTIKNPYFWIVGPWLAAALTVTQMAYGGGDVLVKGSQTLVTVIEQGHKIRITRIYEKARECKTLSVSHILVPSEENGEVLEAQHLPTTSALLQQKKGVKTSITRIIDVTLIPDGRYRYRTTPTWSCNPFHKESKPYFSKPFTLIRTPPSPSE